MVVEEQPNIPAILVLVSGAVPWAIGLGMFN